MHDRTNTEDSAHRRELPERRMPCVLDTQRGSVAVGMRRVGTFDREWQGRRVVHAAKGDGLVVKVDYSVSKPVHVVFDSCTSKAHW